MLRILTLALLGLLLICVPSDAGMAPQYEWVTVSPVEYALLYAGRQIGSIRQGDGYFTLLPDGNWIASDCPCNLPAGLQKASSPAPANHTCQQKCACGCLDSGVCDCGKYCPCFCGCDQSGKCSCGKGSCIKNDTKPELPNYGVDSAKVHSGKHEINGRSVSRAEIISAIKDVPKDENKLRLTLISAEPLLTSLSATLRQFAEEHDLLFQAYTPDSWAVTGAGFYTGACPEVYLQAPDGKVLLRLDSFGGKTEGPLVEAVRTANPAYDPSKDPTGQSGLQSILNLLRSLPGEVWAAICGLFYFLRKKEN